jgi:two-component system OmpR family response regulator/two-component system alkaline phosphatase synthesis response regulator PhoP
VSEKPRALVVEDEPNIRDLVGLHLGLEGFACTGAADGREALRLLREARYDIVILDLMIPHVDGVSVCRAMRREGPNAMAPVLMLTARREESDKVLGLESGADDYLTKPFGVRELVARVRALMRRAAAPRAVADGGEPAAAAPQVLHVRDLEIDPARRRVRASGADVDLTAQEFSLLHVLASHPGIVFSRDALLTRVWKGETYVTDRSVDALVKRLRKKIEPDPAAPVYILTVWGSGYKFTDA